MLAELAEGVGVLPRGGGVMDQDPYELYLLRVGLRVRAEKQKQEEDRRAREAK